MDHAKVLCKLSSSSLSSWENGREEKRERAFIWALIFLLACFAPSLELCVCFLFLQVLDTNFSFLFPALCHPDKCTEHWGWCSVSGIDLQMMSNERFSSVVHRAVANSSEPRLSMVCFLRASSWGCFNCCWRAHWCNPSCQIHALQLGRLSYNLMEERSTRLL